MNFLLPSSRCAAVGLLAAAALLLGAPAAFAQPADYPNKPVKVVVAFTAGGTTDILARAVSAADFACFVNREFEKWKVVVRESGATTE